MYWAYVVRSQLKNHNENNDMKSPDNKSKEVKSKDNNCGNCGQNPYFCQCPSVITHSLKDNFNFEKSNY